MSYDATTKPVPDHAWGQRSACRRGDRIVHFRRLSRPGAPVAVLVHGSPESASAVHGMARALAPWFDVIAIDTPGNGLSSPLPVPHPESSDYAAELLEILTDLGVTTFGIYGFHSGAATAMQVALQQPQRVRALALDGYPVWTEAERQDLVSRYCEVYPPTWNGSHLTQTWARLEEQLRFFPWNTPAIDARMNLPPTPIATRMRRLRDWLTAWDSYPAPYLAAFRFEGEQPLLNVEVPTLMGAMGADPLRKHFSRMPPLGSNIQRADWGEDAAGAVEQIVAHLRAFTGAPAPAVTGVTDDALCDQLATPEPRDFMPDDHGGFLLKLWNDLRWEAIESARTQAELDARLDPVHLHRRLTAIVQAHVGL